MKLQRLHINGYQSHKQTVMDFSPGLNVIVGPSHNGKTAIMRALKKVFYDTPAGADFINFGMTECVICAEMDSGIVWRIIHSKNGKIGRNEYKVKSKSSSESTFAGFGRTVPVEVEDLTGVKKLTVGGEVVDLVFSSQLDGPFLLKRGSVWAKLFGRATGVDVLDQCAKEAKSRIAKAGQEEKFRRDELVRLTERYEALSEQVGEDESVIITLSEKVSYLKDRVEKLLILESCIIKGRAIRDKVIRAEHWLNELKDGLQSAEKDLDEYLRSSDLCPYSGVQLPAECVKGIQARA